MGIDSIQESGNLPPHYPVAYKKVSWKIQAESIFSMAWRI